MPPISLTMPPAKLTRKDGVTCAEIPWLSVPKIIPAYFPKFDYDRVYTVRNIAKKLCDDSVQARMQKHLGEQRVFNNIESINISEHFPEGHLALSKDFKQIEISLDEAQALHGEKLVVVLSGGSDRGFAHIGALMALEEMGINPDIIIGTSAGSIVAALYAIHASARKVYEISMGLASKHSWQDLIRMDLWGLRHNWQAFNGLASSDRLINILRDECGIGEKTFKDTEKELGIISVDLDQVKTMLMADKTWMENALAYDASEMNSSTYPKNAPFPFPGRGVKIIDAIAASTALPGIFKMKEMWAKAKDNKAVTFSLTDGGVGENLAIRTAANIIPAGAIIGISLGFSEDKTRTMAHTNFLNVTNKAFDAEGYVQMSSLSDYQLLKGFKYVRIGKPGIYLPTPLAYNRAQDQVASTLHTMRRMFKIMPKEAFIAHWQPSDIETFKKHGFDVEIYQDYKPNANVVLIREEKPLINAPASSLEMQKLYGELGGQVITKQPEISNTDWFLKQVKETYGKPWLYFFGVVAFVLKKFFWKIPRTNSVTEEAHHLFKAALRLLKDD
jgi:predicted acylesterase/phospholipase RssA